VEAGDHANQQHFDGSGYRCQQVARRDEFGCVHVCRDRVHHRGRPDNRERVI
jgi:hypothetical protein